MRFNSAPVRCWEFGPKFFDPKRDITLSSLQRAAALAGRQVAIESVQILQRLLDLTQCGHKMLRGDGGEGCSGRGLFASKHFCEYQLML
jgi:hypothetical protein